mmetsp:Transcript_9804/g.36407  ORF Transcript_9804/g.36407 Transcript_9804/m.36407 type:complete len:320 (+) Transcript_9804:1135-2094(+)
MGSGRSSVSPASAAINASASSSTLSRKSRVEAVSSKLFGGMNPLGTSGVAFFSERSSSVDDVDASDAAVSASPASVVSSSSSSDPSTKRSNNLSPFDFSEEDDPNTFAAEFDEKRIPDAFESKDVGSSDCESFSFFFDLDSPSSECFPASPGGVLSDSLPMDEPPAFFAVRPKLTMILSVAPFFGAFWPRDASFEAFRTSSAANRRFASASPSRIAASTSSFVAPVLSRMVRFMSSTRARSPRLICAESRFLKAPDGGLKASTVGFAVPSVVGLKPSSSSSTASLHTRNACTPSFRMFTGTRTSSTCHGSSSSSSSWSS